MIRLCQFHFLPAFLLAIYIVFSAFKLLGSSCYSLNYQHSLSSKFTSLASNSATNQFLIGYSCPPFIPQHWPSIHVIFNSLYAIASASLCLPQSPLPTSYQQYSCLSWIRHNHVDFCVLKLNYVMLCRINDMKLNLYGIKRAPLVRFFLTWKLRYRYFRFKERHDRFNASIWSDSIRTNPIRLLDLDWWISKMLF